MTETVKTPADSLTEQIQIVFAEHVNGVNRLFGGNLMKWMDVVAAVVARRHSAKEVTTASVDRIDFSAPAGLNDTIVLIGKIVHVGNTSMRVKVTAFVEKLSGERTVINTAKFVMVALDGNDRPVRVPRLKPVTADEIRDYEEYEKLRKKF